MILKKLLFNIIYIILAKPIIALIHELGHVFFIKLFGGKIDKLLIGEGKTIIKIGLLEIGEKLDGGECHENFSDNNQPTEWKLILSSLGGVLATCTTGILLTSFLFFSDINNILFYYLLIINIFLFADLLNLIPIKDLDICTDGYYILENIIKIIEKKI